MLAALKEDPYNRSGKHDIKKLASLKPGEGQWRIRAGDYRLRYISSATMSFYMLYGTGRKRTKDTDATSVFSLRNTGAPAFYRFPVAF